jgi:hypothetical protein
MKRYKQKYFEVGPMEEHHNGDWVKFEDAVSTGERYSEYVFSELHILDEAIDDLGININGMIDDSNKVTEQIEQNSEQLDLIYDSMVGVRKVWLNRVIILGTIALVELIIIGLVI